MLAIGVLGALAAATLWAAGADWVAAVAKQRAEAALHAADIAPPGLPRDALLDEAQTHLQIRLNRQPEDAAAWARLAEVRFLQATGAAIGSLSPSLLRASLEADAKAEQLGRESAADYARRSLALSLLGESGATAAAWLAKSYRLEPEGAGLGARRLGAAERLWPQLDAATRKAIRGEACALLQEGLVLDPIEPRALPAEHQASGVVATFVTSPQAKAFCPRRSRRG